MEKGEFKFIDVYDTRGNTNYQSEMYQKLSHNKRISLDNFSKYREVIDDCDKFLLSQKHEGHFDTYGPVFEYTTENIASSLGNYTEKDRILTVLSSGDHVFNYLERGATDIETFDINKITKYFFDLKCAWIKKLSFNDFENIHDSSKWYFSLDRLDEFAPFLDNSTYLFWRYYLERCDMFSPPFIYNMATIKRKDYNLYFNEKSYNRIKAILNSGLSFKFHNANALDLYKHISGTFSEIHFSNLFDYIRNKDVVKIVENELTQFLTTDGRILFYSFGKDNEYISSLGYEEARVNPNGKLYTYRKR